MQHLVKGLHSFQTGYFAKHRELFEQLATTGQRPETLFITCSDSRVIPNLITNAPPGELFVVRNVGNVVPSADLPGGTAAAIEYAICVLEVQNIILCGHTGCGAIEAIMNPARTANLPFVSRWLAETDRVRRIIEERYAHLEGDAKLLAATQENVLFQIEHLRAYRFVAERLEAGKLHVSGWIFDISTGQVFDYDPFFEKFTPLIAPAT